jgi:hypothetical protein
MGLAVLMLLLLLPQATAQQVDPTAEPAQLARGYRTRTHYRPRTAILGGVVGIGGRHYFLRDRPWTPYYTLAGGMAWTSLEVPEVDRIWNFQVVWGAGIKRIPRRGPGLSLEFRNHHISNAGTRGENLGVNAAMMVVGVHWVLR